MHKKTQLTEHELLHIPLSFISSLILHIIQLWLVTIGWEERGQKNKVSFMNSKLAASLFPSLHLWIYLALSKDIILYSIHFRQTTAQHVLVSVLSLCSEMTGHKKWDAEAGYPLAESWASLGKSHKRLMTLGLCLPGQILRLRLSLQYPVHQLLLDSLLSWYWQLRYDMSVEKTMISSKNISTTLLFSNALTYEKKNIKDLKVRACIPLYCNSSLSIFTVAKISYSWWLRPNSSTNFPHHKLLQPHWSSHLKV